jgi:hypothetical protein
LGAFLFTSRSKPTVARSMPTNQTDGAADGGVSTKSRRSAETGVLRGNPISGF